MAAQFQGNGFAQQQQFPQQGGFNPNPMGQPQFQPNSAPQFNGSAPQMQMGQQGGPQFQPGPMGMNPGQGQFGSNPQYQSQQPNNTCIDALTAAVSDLLHTVVAPTFCSAISSEKGITVSQDDVKRWMRLPPPSRPGTGSMGGMSALGGGFQNGFQMPQSTNQIMSQTGNLQPQQGKCHRVITSKKEGKSLCPEPVIDASLPPKHPNAMYCSKCVSMKSVINNFTDEQKAMLASGGGRMNFMPQAERLPQVHVRTITVQNGDGSTKVITVTNDQDSYMMLPHKDPSGKDTYIVFARHINNSQVQLTPDDIRNAGMRGFFVHTSVPDPVTGELKPQIIPPPPQGGFGPMVNGGPNVPNSMPGFFNPQQGGLQQPGTQFNPQFASVQPGQFPGQPGMPGQPGNIQQFNSMPPNQPGQFPGQPGQFQGQPQPGMPGQFNPQGQQPQQLPGQFNPNPNPQGQPQQQPGQTGQFNPNPQGQPQQQLGQPGQFNPNPNPQGQPQQQPGQPGQFNPNPQGQPQQQSGQPGQFNSNPQGQPQQQSGQPGQFNSNPQGQPQQQPGQPGQFNPNPQGQPQQLPGQPGQPGQFNGNPQGQPGQPQQLPGQPGQPGQFNGNPQGQPGQSPQQLLGQPESQQQPQQPGQPGQFNSNPQGQPQQAQTGQPGQFNPNSQGQPQQPGQFNPNPQGQVQQLPGQPQPGQPDVSQVNGGQQVLSPNQAPPQVQADGAPQGIPAMPTGV